ncbi:hypothetical protein LLG10_04450 [bacterium]|nr:hypothetical protein [bacterium]
MSEQVDFLFPRLVGKRFDNHSIPLDFFRDLASMGELLFELAKWIYKIENENKRIPKNFFDGISIKVSNIKNGSAIPTIVIEQPLPPACLFKPHNKLVYFEKSRDCFFEAIRNADEKEKVISFIPDYLLKHFDSIGRGLYEDEYIEFKTPKCETSVIYNSEKRKKLVMASSKTKEYSEGVVIRGYVPEADQDKKVFTIQQFNGQMFQAPVYEELWDDILMAFTNYEKKQIIELKGVGIRSINGKLLKIGPVESISILDNLDITVQLEQLSLLKDGWLDGKGIAPDSSLLNWLTSEFNSNYETSLPLPYFYPTPEGGIQAEWSNDKWEISLHIDLKSSKSSLQAVNIISKEIQEKDINLKIISGWTELNQILLNLLGSSE